MPKTVKPGSPQQLLDIGRVDKDGRVRITESAYQFLYDLWRRTGGDSDEVTQTWVQASAPTAKASGDLWIDSGNGNKIYRWSGSAWVEYTSNSAAVGAITTFSQASAPTAIGAGDLWVDTDDNNKVYRWSGSSWVEQNVYGVAVGADVTATQVSGRGANVFNRDYSINPNPNVDFGGTSDATVAIATSAVGSHGPNIIQLTATSSNGITYFGSSATDYNTQIEPSKKWLLSAWVYGSAASMNGQLHIKTSAGTVYTQSFTTSGSATTWTRVGGTTVLDLSADTSEFYVARIDNDHGSGTISYDMFMLEEYTGDGTTVAPSAYSPPGVEGTTNDWRRTIDSQGNLAAGVAVDDGGGTYWAVPKGIAFGTVDDADAITFDTAWTSVPNVIVFGNGALTYDASLTGDQTLNFRATGVTTSGFTAALRIAQVTGTPTARTETTATDPGWNGGQSIDINKGATGDEPADDTYTYQYDITIVNVPEEGGYSPGSVTIGLYANDGGGWVQYGTKTHNGGSTATTSHTNLKATVTVDGLGLNDDFGIDIVSELISGGTIDSFDQVTYTSVSGATDASATVSGSTKAIYMVIGT